MISWVVQWGNNPDLVLFSPVLPWYFGNVQTQCYRSRQPDEELRSYLRAMMRRNRTPLLVRVWGVHHLEGQAITSEVLQGHEPAAVYKYFRGAFRLKAGIDVL